MAASIVNSLGRIKTHRRVNLILLHWVRFLIRLTPKSIKPINK
nr:MAG TPA: hypothetical protein [Caudoviricetes sp.]